MQSREIGQGDEAKAAAKEKKEQAKASGAKGGSPILKALKTA